MPARPDTLHVPIGGTRLGYQVLHDGDHQLDVVLLDGSASNVETRWDQPRFAEFAHGLAGLGRLVLHDPRGVGTSDRGGPLPTLEERVEDTVVVMDAAGVDDAVVIGLAGGSPVAALLAATHPQRVRLLVLYAVWARGNPADPATITAWGGRRDDDLHSVVVDLRAQWGEGYTATRWAPSLLDDDGFVRWCADYERSIASVDGAVALARLDHDWDITPALPSIQAPTLIVQRVNDEVCVAPHARFVAGHMEGVTYVEMPGVDHWSWAVDGDGLVNEITSFVAAAPPDRIGFDRMLATVVVTDVMDATPLTKGTKGRRTWYEHLDDHDALLRRTLDAFRGEPVATTGDGFVARFASAARAVRWADELRRQTIPLGIELRTGVHTGELPLVPEGPEAVTVRIAERLGNLAQPNEIIASRTVTDLVRGTSIEFAPRGERELPGVPGIWPILAVTDC